MIRTQHQRSPVPTVLADVSSFILPSTEGVGTFVCVRCQSDDLGAMEYPPESKQWMLICLNCHNSVALPTVETSPRSNGTHAESIEN